MGDNRAERRRQARAAARNPHERTPVLIAGDGIAAASLGHQYEGRPSADLPPKKPGEHRFVASGVWVLRSYAAEEISDPDTMKFLDNENLMMLAVWCWDCERPVADGFDPRSACPA